MVLCKLPVPGHPTIWMTVGQGPIVLAVGAGCLDIFTLLYLFPYLSPSFSPGFLPALSWPRGSIPIGNIAELIVIVPSGKS